MHRQYQRPIVGMLQPPNTPAGLPHGLERGGIFEGGDVPMTFIDAVQVTVPTDSPQTSDVPMNIFQSAVPFADPTRPRVITGMGQLPTVVVPFGQAPGQRRYYTSYDRGHRHHVDMPMRGMGQMVQGMGPQPGFRMMSPDAPPLPIHRWAPAQTPHGMTEGGIFGHRAVMNGMATGGRVPGVRTMDVIDERTTRALTGYGAGPDGLGGCGSCNGW